MQYCSSLLSDVKKKSGPNLKLSPGNVDTCLTFCRKTPGYHYMLALFCWDLYLIMWASENGPVDWEQIRTSLPTLIFNRTAPLVTRFDSKAFNSNNPIILLENKNIAEIAFYMILIYLAVLSTEDGTVNPCQKSQSDLSLLELIRRTNKLLVEVL